jgi:galactonate dehydratase
MEAVQMKISGIELIHVLPRYTILKLSTDEGIVGYGEAVLEGKSRTVEMAVKEYEKFLIGQDPRRIEHLWQAIYRQNFYRGGPILTSALSGLDQALWDILGKSLNVPVYQLLGGAVRERVRMYKHVQGETPEALAESARKAVAEGYTMVKTTLVGKAHILETPAFVTREVERVEALRAAIGGGVDFGVDFHGRVSPALAIRLAKEMERFSPVFIEEPCLPENIDALVTVARATSIPVATGERLFTKWGFRELLEKQAAFVLQPDLAHCGGITEGKKIAAMAECYYAAIAPHNPLGPVNLAASLQLDACAPNFLAQEFVQLGEGYLKRPFVVKDGYIELPTAPGLGIELDEEALAGKIYPGDFTNMRWFHDDDGSVADR